MRYDVVADVYTEGATSDGMGGKVTTNTKVGTIHCVFTPLQESTQNEVYGVNKKGMYKVVTADTISVTEFKLYIHGNFYKPYYDRDYYPMRRRVMMVERIDD